MDTPIFILMDGTATSYALKHNIEDKLYNKTVSAEIIDEIQKEVKNEILDVYKKMDGSKFTNDDIEVFIIDEELISSSDIINGNTKINPKYSNGNFGVNKNEIDSFMTILKRCNKSMQNSNDIDVYDSSFLGDYRIVTLMKFD